MATMTGAERQAARREIYAAYNKQTKAAGCLNCGETFVHALQWHHINPATKTEGVARMFSAMKPFEVINAEIAKCVLLCANCHAKVEYGGMKVEDMPNATYNEG